MQYLQFIFCTMHALRASQFTGTWTPLEINLSKTDFPTLYTQHKAQAQQQNNYLKSAFV